MQDNVTALMLAACSGSAELVQIFLECGANVNAQDNVSYSCTDMYFVCIISCRDGK